jgi:anaerobic selenocysteine-containing dehydrogenase
MTFGSTDRLTGSKRRDAVFMSPDDAEKLGLADGAPVMLRSETGAMSCVVKIAPVKAGTLQAYWPEANVLIARRVDPISGEPDYNTEVRVEKAAP